MATYQIRSGDTITSDPSALTKRDGTAPDGTGGSARIQWDDWLGTQIVNAAAVISNPNPLKLTYTFLAADTARKGVFRLKWIFTYASGVIETFPTVPDDLLLFVA